MTPKELAALAMARELLLSRGDGRKKHDRELKGIELEKRLIETLSEYLSENSESQLRRLMNTVLAELKGTEPEKRLIETVLEYRSENSERQLRRLLDTVLTETPKKISEHVNSLE
jgi:hypothetical protein